MDSRMKTLLRQRAIASFEFAAEVTKEYECYDDILFYWIEMNRHVATALQQVMEAKVTAWKPKRK